MSEPAPALRIRIIHHCRNKEPGCCSVFGAVSTGQQFHAGGIITAPCGAELLVQVVGNVPESAELAVSLLDDPLYSSQGMKAVVGLPCKVMFQARSDAKYHMPLARVGHEDEDNTPASGVTVPLRDGAANLGVVMFTETTWKVLHSRNACVRLLLELRLRGSTGRLRTVAYLVSQPFKVTTDRNKYNAKHATPGDATLVAQVNGVGKATKEKLADLRRASKGKGKECGGVMKKLRALKLTKITKAGELKSAIGALENVKDGLEQFRILLGLCQDQWQELLRGVGMELLGDQPPSDAAGAPGVGGKPRKRTAAAASSGGGASEPSVKAPRVDEPRPACPEAAGAGSTAVPALDPAAGVTHKPVRLPMPSIGAASLVVPPLTLRVCAAPRRGGWGVVETSMTRATVHMPYPGLSGIAAGSGISPETTADAVSAFLHDNVSPQGASPACAGACSQHDPTADTLAQC